MLKIKFSPAAVLRFIITTIDNRPLISKLKYETNEGVITREIVPSMYSKSRSIYE
jgi:hypothetical protein